MRTPTICFALVLASATACRGLAAQEMPTFHNGEWAAEFSGGSGTNAGVMRFFSPRSALVLSGGGTVSHTTTTPDAGSKSTTNVQTFMLALGVRRHTPVAPRVLATTELGASVDFAHSKTTTDGFGNPVDNRLTQTSVGIYGEIGGQYFVASHLALGAVATINASVSTGRNENGGSAADLRGFLLSTSLRPIRITLYF